MFLKVIFANHLPSQHLLLINVNENFEIKDLKFQLEEHTKIPKHCLKIWLFDEILGDDFPVYRAYNQKKDLVVEANDSPLCLLRAIDDDPMMDRDMDLEASCSSAQSSMASTSGPSEGSFNGNSMSGDRSISDSVKRECSPRDPCAIHCCAAGADRPDYARVMPEDRRYGVVIQNEVERCDCNPCICKFGSVQKFLYQAFRRAEDPASLNFSQCMPAVAFDCLLVFVCKDSDTSDWLIRTMQSLSPPYKCTTFIKHFELVRCSFVLPMVNHVEFCAAFHGMENLNPCLDTKKWCVVRKTLLETCSEDYASKVIYKASKNYEIVVYMDKASRDYILSKCGKIKFQMWRLPVDFSTALPCE
ncbi:hypothetical protein KR084_000059 [Drosophila pseudotakahashii]|nr:hypothetical protein KR084_000059 [Drosophila pseudotakahashii]